jgi:hypothetical protein
MASAGETVLCGAAVGSFFCGTVVSSGSGVFTEHAVKIKQQNAKDNIINFVLFMYMSLSLSGITCTD